MSKSIVAAVVVSTVVFVAIILWLASGARSGTETALSSVLLTIVSIGATWIVSHSYYLMANSIEIERVTQQHDESLRTYARKAAEKVTNLSSELRRLSTYLNEYLEYQSDGDSLEVVMSQRDERLIGAIHVVEMLRSVNDTSLSDWHGVIGEELEKKKEQQEETEARKEQAVIESLDKMAHMLEDYRDAPREPIDESRIISQINDMRAELTTIALGLRTPMSSRIAPVPPKMRNKTYLPCPMCQSDVEIISTRAGKVKYKGYICGSCDTRLVVRPDADGRPVIDLRRLQPEDVACPLCKVTTVAELDNVGGAATVINCSGCGVRIRISRNLQNISISPIDSDRPDANFVTSVRELLPLQPWPKGVHLHVAFKLESTPARVQRAIQELIDTGIFKPQIDGVVREPPPISSREDEIAVAERDAGE